jgi:SfnB family sulfur acquisition oxidoreductase
MNIPARPVPPVAPVPSGSPVPPVPRPAEKAHVLSSDAEAIEVATALAAEFAPGAADRDRDRIWPQAELDRFSQSGLWSMNVPRAFGGPEVSYVTLNRVLAIIAEADPSISQIAQNHLGLIAAIRTVSDPEQQADLFAEVLSGTRFGNAFSEFGSKRAAEFETRFADHGDHVVVTGRKFYCTGALLAHLVPIVAVDDAGRAWYAIADRGAEGLTVIDDWSAMGQRTTLSGTVLLDEVTVPKARLVPGWKGYDRPTADGAIFQVIQAAIDLGIARAAIRDTIDFVRNRSRPWIDSGLDHAWQDPYTIQAIGALVLKANAAEAILDRSGHAIDAAVAEPTEASVAKAQIAVAEAKILTTEIAIEATNRLFELAGTRATLAQHNLDRHWRNARTHTLHDPVRWKYAILGNHYLNGINPPLHAWS